MFSRDGRPRASSDTYTALPARVLHRDSTRQRRASDATRTPPLRGPPQPRSSTLSSSVNSTARLPPSYTAANAQIVETSRGPHDVLSARRDSGPMLPPRSYESPTLRGQHASNVAHRPSPEYRRGREIIRVSTPVSPRQSPTYNFGSERAPSIPLRAHIDNNKYSLAEEPVKLGEKDMTSDFAEPDDEFDPDMFVRAMQLNGDAYERDSTDVDEDAQPYSEPMQSSRNAFSLGPQHAHPNGEAGEGRRLSYRERRKKGKHRIVYNRDSVENQQRFIILLARALIAFGSPSHRVEPQLASVASLFELPAQFVHTVGCVQICFGQLETHSSETLLIKADSTLDLGRINDTHSVYRAVVRDEISASEGYSRLEEIIRRKPIYSRKLLFVLTFIQGFVLCGSSFGGSINDMWVAGVLSLLVMLAQLRASRSQLSSSGADIFIAGIISLVSRALSAQVPGQIFCYQAISSASIAGLLPGSVMLSGVLDIASKNIYLGSSKVVSGLMTSLYLGFGLTIGSDVWLHFDKSERDQVASLADKFETFNGTFHSTNTSTPDWLSPANLTGIWSFQETSIEATNDIVAGCYRNQSWSWWLQPLPWYSLFALLPVLNLVLSMKRAQPLWTIEMPVMIAISCTSSAVTRLANRHMALSGHPDYTALLGSFVVSLLGNLYSRRMGGTAFTIMLTGIWLLIPTGLAEAGGLASSYISPGEDEYTESLDLARKMISVIIGVMSGVYLSARIIYAFGKKKNSALMTF